ncbi:MAG: hypothetical protein GAK28_04472 [Luteibacter sp.]|uniref:HNH endonuclease n=1 Tax=Luteibacter sp. TaxID=1886636 RepID=UPI001382A3E4|nr:SAVED domain-containing protein [Luteibacter sp.]KAF1003705.1 MAG: hypothetical protein GAK28_04472 [Luteibacter sp.]
MAGSNRSNTGKKALDAVWIRAAGHCELCSKDLTRDRITLTPAKLGQVAHILPASPDGPRSTDGHTVDAAEALTNDPGNLMLLCASCHVDIDKTPEGYPAQDLTYQHEAFLDAVKFAANSAHSNPGTGMIVLGQHFQTKVRIDPSQLQAAMWRDCIRPVGAPLIVELPEPDQEGRDDRYYRAVRSRLDKNIRRDLSPARSVLGDEPWLGVAAIADIPSLVILGKMLGDRRRRKIYSSDRTTGLVWRDGSAVASPFTFDFNGDGDETRPIALVISISAFIPERDVHAVLPNASVARFTAAAPSYDYVQNADFIGHFRDQIQRRLSELEAYSPLPIHVLPAIPAALAIEFGAVLSTNHQHCYWIYDRDGPTDAFRRHVSLDHLSKEYAA